MPAIGRRWVMAAAAVLFVCAAIALAVRLGAKRPEDFWSAERGLSVSERAYVIQKADRLLEEWRNTRSELYTRRGEAPRPYNVYLVVDLDQHAMWIERDGRVWHGWRVDLPDKLDWSIQRLFVHGTESLGPVARFKIRGWATRPERPEIVYVVGRIRGGGYVGLFINSSSGGSDYSSNDFQPAPMQASDMLVPEDQLYPSFVVSADEYRAAAGSPSGPQPVAGAGDAAAREDSLLVRQRADWERVEARFYREIERQIERQGLHLSDLDVQPGPDFHAGHAELRARRGRVASMLHPGPGPRAALGFDYLGDDVWYVRSVRDPRGPWPSTMDLEFLVCAREQMQGSEADWLAKGRDKVAQPGVAPSPWSVTLPNGAELEFIGVCRAPTLGRQWWGPDGSPIEALPYVSTRTDEFGRPGAWFEIAWRAVPPQPGSRTQMSASLFSGCSANRGVVPKDRYGWAAPSDVSCEQYEFREGQESTTGRLGVGVDGGEFEWAEFRNISLVPGTDSGFEMGPSTGPAH